MHIDEINQLRSALGRDAADVDLVETHISWVLLAGTDAWKIKKPVNFGFVDFSTPELRARACADELRLNRRLAPELYLGVVSVVARNGTLAIGGAGRFVEYAVHMRRFDHACVASDLADRGALRADQLDAFAADLARFHASLPPSDAQCPFGKPDDLQARTLENFEPIQSRLGGSGELASLRERLTGCFDALAERMERRRADGFVRECHGDLHLGNLVEWGGRLLAFDCLEFNAALRWGDVAAEIAFPYMDLMARGHPRMAWRFLDRYLARSGDYAALGLLGYCTAYRALVRAKVAALSATDGDPATGGIRHYVELAREFVRPRRGALVFMHGVSGSGKSVVADEIAQRLGGVRIRADVERKRLAGRDAGDRLEPEFYTDQWHSRTMQRLLDLGLAVAAAGYVAVLDATWLDPQARANAIDQVRARGVSCAIVSVHADVDTLRERVAARSGLGNDPSDADLAVLEAQLAGFTPLTCDEAGYALTVDTCDGRLDYDELAVQLRRLIE